MKLYKILIKKDNKYYSPFQSYCYGTLSELLNNDFKCKDFDNSDTECSNGYYATEIQGLIYTKLSDNPNKVVFEVEMSGKNKKFSDYKWRWEHQKFIKEISLEQIKQLVKNESEKMEWNYYNMLFPYNPLLIRTEVTREHIKLLKKWASVRDSVWASVWASVRASVWASVRASVGASVRAYISSGFPNIEKWEHIKHKKGVNPFQSCIDLWNDNLVPSFDGKTWRLHSGEKAEIVFKISKEDLKNYK